MPDGILTTNPFHPPAQGAAREYGAGRKLGA